MTGIDPLSLMLGVALFPVARMYWRLLISGINTVRDYVPHRAEAQDSSVSIDDFVVLPRSILKFKETKDRGFIEFKKYEEGEYVIET